MKITKKILENIIKEEILKILSEDTDAEHGDDVRRMQKKRGETSTWKSSAADSDDTSTSNKGFRPKSVKSKLSTDPIKKKEKMIADLKAKIKAEKDPKKKAKLKADLKKKQSELTASAGNADQNTPGK